MPRTRLSKLSILKPFRQVSQRPLWRGYPVRSGAEHGLPARRNSAKCRWGVDAAHRGIDHLPGAILGDRFRRADDQWGGDYRAVRGDFGFEAFLSPCEALIFGVLRREIQGVGDCITGDRSFVAEVFLVLPSCVVAALPWAQIGAMPRVVSMMRSSFFMGQDSSGEAGRPGYLPFLRSFLRSRSRMAKLTGRPMYGHSARIVFSR